jgi:hypothetical protein
MHAFERVLSRVAAPDGLRRRRIKGDGFPAPPLLPCRNGLQIGAC